MMGKNSRDFRWEHRTLDISARFQRRLEAKGYQAKVRWIGDIIPPDSISADVVFEIESNATYEDVSEAIGAGLLASVCRLPNGRFQAWCGYL